MVVDHSPVREPKGEIDLPTGRLAAVTRKANEIEELLGSVEVNKDLIKDLFNQYLVKVEVLHQACSSSRQTSWLSQHTDKISLFRNKVENILHPPVTITPSVEPRKITDLYATLPSTSRDFNRPSSRRNSVVSGISNTSSASALRVRLATQRAKLEASKQVADEVFRLETEELRLKFERKRLEERQLEKENTILEQELAKIDLDSISDAASSVVQEFRERHETDAVNNTSAFAQIERAPPQALHVVPLVSHSTPAQRLEPSDATHNISRTQNAVTTSSNSDVSASSEHCNTRLMDILEAQNEISQKIALSQQRASLPKKDIYSFDGKDVTRYKIFKMNFDRNIASECTTDADRYLYLQQYTTDKAQKLVNSCSHYDPAVAYRCAISLLDKEYGNEYSVSSAYIEKLRKWPVIKADDTKALEELSIFLVECLHHCETMTSLNQLHSPQEIMSIVHKLPYRMRDRWRRRCHDLQEQYSNVYFKDLVKFISKEVSVLKLPIFGDISDSKGKESENNTKTRGKKSLLTSNSTSKLCLYCKKDNHLITDCIFFGKLSAKEKTDFVKKNKLCFGCLKGNHFSKHCKAKLKCNKCSKQHPTILHDQQRKSQEQEGSTPTIPAATPGTSQGGTATPAVTSPGTSTGTTVCASRGNLSSTCKSKVIFPYLPVKVKASVCGKEISINCALDSCSTDCWASEDLVKKLNLKTASKSLTLSTMHHKEKTLQTKVINNLIISDYDSNHSVTIPVVYTKSSEAWPFSREDLVKHEDVSDLHYLDEVPFHFTTEDIDLLIGCNVPQVTRPLEVVAGRDNQPYASRHLVGWALNGPVPRNGKRSICNRISINEGLSLNNEISRMFSQDFVDPNPTEKSYSIEDSKFISKVQSTIKKLHDSHYEVKLPLRDNYSFPNNRNQAYHYFLGTKKRLDRDSALCEDYHEFMKMMLDNKFAEIISNCELSSDTEPVWYITHHAVYHKQKRKIRVVFNCSLECKSVSLNSNLLSGPDLTSNLFGVLLRFRQGPVAVTADIQKMFYQVRIPPEQRNLLRFFWLDSNNAIQEYRLLVHVFGAVSSPAVAQYALKETVREMDDSNPVKATVNRSFYVDDLLKSYDDEATALQEVPLVISTLASGGFNLTSFNSNSAEILRCVAQSHPSPSVDLTSDLESTSTLGIIWNIKNDELGFRVNITSEDKITKRQLLQVLASFYDPHGFAAPAIVQGKLLFQEACRENINWDELLPSNIQIEWNKWLKTMNCLSNYFIPRCLKISNAVEKYEIHTFADGSERAYGCVSYLKTFYTDGSVSVTLISSKSRLTPLNNSVLKTVPRIELCAAKLAAEHAQKLKSELDIPTSSVFWSDSTTVLAYLKNETSRFQRFVANKISFIRSLSKPEDWYYVHTKENPADLLSRGCSPKFIINSHLWRNGPAFLRERCCSVEHAPRSKISVDSNDPEVKKTSTLLITSKTEESPLHIIMNSCSTWTKLRRRVASLLMLKDCLHRKVGFKNRSMSTELLRRSEMEIFKFIQKIHFEVELEKCAEKTRIPKSSKLRKLNPFLDEHGILRVGGRLARSHASFNVKHPIILPSSLISEILLRDVHFRVGHLGRETVLASARKLYYILGANVLIRKILRDCLICRKLNARPCEQIMADLPGSRVLAYVAPFHHIRA